MYEHLIVAFLGQDGQFI